MLQSYVVRSLKIHKSALRLYLDMTAMLAAGFRPGATYIRKKAQDKAKITLEIVPNGTHVVSGKESTSGRITPVIDLNSNSALDAFEGMQAVRVVVLANRIIILPLASEVNRADRMNRLRISLDKGLVTTAGICFGGGTLDYAAHQGLAESGLHAKLALANEFDADMLEHASRQNPIWNEGTIALASPMQEVVQDAAAMSQIPTVDLVCCGIPCSGASIAGKTKRGLSMMENHSEVGGLIAPFVMFLNKLQPALICLENVVEYRYTASAEILRQWLTASGYEVHETELNAADFGCLEARERWFMVATSRGIELDLAGLEPAARPVRTLGEVMEQIGPEDEAWRDFQYLKAKRIRDEAKGSGFETPVLSPSSTRVNTLRKGYAKLGSCDALISHPTNPDLMRAITVKEHSRIKQFPESLTDGLSKTDGHALLGQGVAFAPVQALFKRIGEALVQWKSAKGASAQTLSYNLKMATG